MWLSSSRFFSGKLAAISKGSSRRLLEALGLPPGDATQHADGVTQAGAGHVGAERIKRHGDGGSQ